MNKSTILVIDADHHAVNRLGECLDLAGYKVVVVPDRLSALKVIELLKPNLVVLDIVMPDTDGFEVCRQIRELSDVPMLVLSRRSVETDKVRCLNLGADDYVTKPFGSEELLARIEAIMRRSRWVEEANRDSQLVCGDVSIDVARRVVKVRDREVDLTPTEFKLLSQLMANSGRVMFHEELLSRVWGVKYKDEIEYLRVCVRYLREKIEDDPSRPRYILSKPGVGYAFASAGGS